MPKLCTYIGFVVCLLVVLGWQSSANFWRRPTLPSDPDAPYYKKFQKVPSVRVTAKKFGTNFLRIRPSFSSRITKRPTIEEDIVVVFDGSGSVGRCEFDKGKKAIKNMMGDANVGQLADTRYAAVTFSNSANVNFKFLSYSLAASKITLIPYPSGGTNTQAGLVEAKNLFDDHLSGRRMNARKIVLLITDGHSNIKKSLTEPKAANLKNSGVKIFVVAVGDYISGIDEMVKVASFPPESYMFRVKKLASFWKVVNLALNKVSPGKYTIADGHFTAPCHYG